MRRWQEMGRKGGRACRGEAKGSAKLSRGAVLGIRNMAGTHAQIAKAFGVSRSTVTRAINGSTWGHI